MEPVVAAALEAMRERDWEAVRQALHPYLHWICTDETLLRGRNCVLAMLADAPPPEPPESVAIRDGQIYRWQA